MKKLTVTCADCLKIYDVTKPIRGCPNCGSPYAVYKGVHVGIKWCNATISGVSHDNNATL